MMPAPDTRSRSIMIRHARTALAAALAAAGIGMAWAQERPGPDAGQPAAAQAAPQGGHDAMPGMDHSAHSAMPGMDHGAMPGMDHGSMNMQGGSAPPDARDPDAYSNGYRLGAGPYALGDTRHLMMADEHRFASVLVERLEWAHGNGTNATAYDAQAWFGTSYDKLVIKAEGDIHKGRVEEARTELLWGHAIAPFWDTQLGLRNDAGTGRPGRSWAAFGVQGLAPYWFHLEATAYVGDSGRTALRLSSEYELLLTQRLILQPRLEASFYGKRDPALEIGSGLSSGTLGLRLRYEFSRQFAPYVGVERSQAFGGTANLIEAAGGRRGETRVVAGVRFWF
ncbi:copper resistance protein B (plasmid) [Ralstonia solanacearum]|nr:Copper resistance protein [Ralstonia solanacearum]APF89228.1 copper resistance protein CopB [Ralstonia solanacearum FJAT-1458]ARS59340.1 copper resistance protein CopB [Ralstonia solanacearum FJAT-91]ESS49912.1 copper resistance protein B [Ralstonia solanacearum SD54]MCK4148304.1 copper resistance protein B [Ralstonia pseudosolanacearum]